MLNEEVEMIACRARQNESADLSICTPYTLRSGRKLRFTSLILHMPGWYPYDVRPDGSISRLDFYTEVFAMNHRWHETMGTVLNGI